MAAHYHAGSAKRLVIVRGDADAADFRRHRKHRAHHQNDVRILDDDKKASDAVCDMTTSVTRRL